MSTETFEKEFAQFLSSRGMTDTLEAFRKELSVSKQNSTTNTDANNSSNNGGSRQELEKEKADAARRASDCNPSSAVPFSDDRKPMSPKSVGPALGPGGSMDSPTNDPLMTTSQSTMDNQPLQQQSGLVESGSENPASSSSRPGSAGISSIAKTRKQSIPATQVATRRREPSEPLPDDAPTHWGAEELGIETFDGDEEELWDIDDHNPPCAPAYTLGAGISKTRFLAACAKDAEVKYVPCDPYQKQAPPTGLPLESFDLRIVYEAGRTGFEDQKDYPIVVGNVIAGRYQVTEFLGSAAFSRAVQCVDLKHNVYVCMKIIRNSKDFFDQSLDEIKLLQYLNSNGDADENHVLQLFDYFYYKEHMFLVCELLRDNLYEFGKYNREQEQGAYFSLVRIQAIAKQVLKALAFVHSLGLLHCDLKPENILIKSYSRCEVKVIDFGSSCFTTDNLSSYVQSRCYRAPEVVLGCKYDGRIDVWSLGCILPELMTGQVLFQNESLCGMLARITALCGPLPPAMLHEGRHTCRYVTARGAFYERVEDDRLVFATPVRTRLDAHIGSSDPDYIDFITQMLVLDPQVRPTAQELLEHPFLSKELGPIGPA